MYRTVFWTLWERERVGGSGGTALKHVYYHIRNESPVQVQYKCLGLVHWDDSKGWYREGGGSGVQDGEHMYAWGGFMLMCGRTNTIL